MDSSDVRMTRGSRLVTVLTAILFVAFLFATVYGIWHLVKLALAKLTTINNNLGATIITSLVFPLILLALKSMWDKRINTELRIRERKSEVYEKFIGNWFDIMFKSRTGDSNDIDAMEMMQKFFVQHTPKLITWASSKVICTYLEFKRAASKHEPGDYTLMFKFEDLLRAFREDIGHSNNGLKRGDLLAMFITDIDEVMRSVSGDGEVARTTHTTTQEDRSA